MSLHGLQERFQSDVLGNGESLCPLIADRARLSPGERLSIYRNAYRARLAEALKETYPKLRLALGDEAFAECAAGYIAAHPSSSRSIRWFGTHLAGHLSRSPPFSGQPVLSELARFEWALGECFDAADAPVFTRGDLARTAPADWGALRFAFHPSLRTLSLSWNAVPIWKALDEAPEAPAPSPARSPAIGTWLLWRQEFQNRFRSVDETESLALAWAIDGASFGEVCEHLASRLPGEEVPMLAAALLANWTDSGLICRAE
jgi:hypothetical protein